MHAITISREYGSGGRTVGYKVARKLGYAFVDHALIVAVARKAKVPVSMVEDLDEHPEAPVKRILKKALLPESGEALFAGWHEGWHAYPVYPQLEEDGPLPLDEDRCVEMIREVMMQMANQGNAVFVGRGGQAVLAGANALHVSISAPREFRITTVMERDGLNRAEGCKQLRAIDTQRQRYLKRHHDIDWADQELYHLMLNTGKLGVDGAVQIIADAVRLQEGGRDAPSTT
jgi:cytidylate kinase